MSATCDFCHALEDVCDIAWVPILGIEMKLCPFCRERSEKIREIKRAEREGVSHHH